MVKQNINIVSIPILYNILEEIKDNLSFKIENFSKPDDFLKFLNQHKSENKNFFIKYEPKYKHYWKEYWGLFLEVR